MPIILYQRPCFLTHAGFLRLGFADSFGGRGRIRALPAAVRLRDDYSATELRALAKRSKDANQSRRLLSLAAIRDGMDRGDAAKIGGMDRDRSISRAGNPRARTTLIQLAWLWLRYQPGSALSNWFRGRAGTLQGRTRRIAIVAMARKLLIALWRYVETGVLPDGVEIRATEEATA
jgi:transposase